jgi:hypothetical protein
MARVSAGPHHLRRVEPLNSPAPQPFPAAQRGQAAVLSTATVALAGPIDTIFPVGDSMRA